jgi:hypothetical protein
MSQPVPSSSLTSTALDIQHFLKLFAIVSGEMCCHVLMIGVFIFVAWVKAWPLQTLAHYTAALGCLSTVCSPQYHNTWSCKVIPLRFTTRSVVMELPVTVAFISGVKCPFNETITSIPQLSQEHPWPLFHDTAKISE